MTAASSLRPFRTGGAGAPQRQDPATRRSAEEGQGLQLSREHRLYPTARGDHTWSRACETSP